ncbi:MAG: acetyltransferase [Eubacterium sp.]|nr:acetyltransferase [Eubacterium sp.]
MKITIIGASGHGKVVAEIAKLNGYEKIEFLDDDESLKSCGEYPVVGKSDKALEIDNDIFIAIGNCQIRKQFIEKLNNKSIPKLIHPEAVVANDVVIEKGTVIMAGVVINPGAYIGKGCIINTCSSVDHDCIVKNYTHIAVGAHLCGTVIVGEESCISAGATVINNVCISDNTIIGAGGVVVTDIIESGVYIGIPVRKMEK